MKPDEAMLLATLRAEQGPPPSPPVEGRPVGRPRVPGVNPDWDGTITHLRQAGIRGYTRHGCRCPGCWDANLRKLASDRLKAQAKRDRAAAATDFQHGVTGWRAHRCRCDVCAAAGAEFNAARRSKQRMEPARQGRRAAEAEPLDWSEVAHLMVGAGVRRGFRKGVGHEVAC